MKHILLRVYIVWFFRRILPLMALEVIGAAVFLKVFANAVFVERTLANASLGRESVWGIVRYLVAAYMNTEFVVQLAILLVLGIAALLLRDLGRAVVIFVRTRR